MPREKLIRYAVFAAVAGVHLLFLAFFAVHIESAVFSAEAPATVMKLTDIQETSLPPPPKEQKVYQSTDIVAETIIETEELPPLPEPGYQAPAAENYLPMHRVSVAPVFAEAEILRSLIYPAIAQRSGVEGMVHLELFIDRYGRVQRVDILRENPEGHGFGEAAAKAFRGRTCTPAMANGVAVAVRYRYPVRFRLR